MVSRKKTVFPPFLAYSGTGDKMKAFVFYTAERQTFWENGRWPYVRQVSLHGELLNVHSYEEAYAVLVTKGLVGWGETVQITFSRSPTYNPSNFPGIEPGVIKEVGTSDGALEKINEYLGKVGLTVDEINEFLAGN